MLYLHCGWPKTGTKSLQAALVKQRDRLEGAGIVYPERWQGRWGSVDRSHNDLVDLLAGNERGPASHDEFLAFLAEHAGSDVLISCEAFTVFMEFAATDPLAFLDATREVTPVKCVWTIRRFDEYRASLYLQLAAMEFALPDPAAYMNEATGSGLFGAMLEIEPHVDRAEYVRYEPGGSHNVELMRSLGLPEEIVRAAEPELLHGARLHRSLSRKQAIAMLNARKLSARAGVEIDRAALRRAFEDGDFAFRADERCEPVGAEVRRAVHKRALEAARECGFDAYPEFFADARIGPSGPSDLSHEDLTDEDLERLLRHLGAAVT